MPLESCMLVLDNSEYMRNGDYLPTRFGAQSQAVSAIYSAKTDANPESAVGLMTMAGKSPSLLATPTGELGKLMSALNQAVIGGLSDLQTAIQVAQLALKHRENKNQRQRIVVFVGSPVEDTQENLVKLGKKLRKNNVLIDIITFGEEGMANDEKMNALIEAAGGGESHLVSIPPSSELLADTIAGTPILYDPEFDTGAGQGSGGAGGDRAVDPEMDPELAMAIQMSLAESQAAAGGSSSTAQPPAAETATSVNLPETMTAPLTNANESTRNVAPASGDMDASAPASGEQQDEEEDDEDEEMRRAMALSRGENPDDDVVMAEEGEDDDDDEEDEEAAMARAIQMSMEDSQNQDGSAK